MDVTITVQGATVADLEAAITAKLNALIGTSNLSATILQVNPATEVEGSGIFTITRTYTLA